MTNGSWAELLDNVSLSEDLFDHHHHRHHDPQHDQHITDPNSNNQPTLAVGKKHGIWCTMLKKIGVKNKRCKDFQHLHHNHHHHSSRDKLEFDDEEEYSDRHHHHSPQQQNEIGHAEPRAAEEKEEEAKKDKKKKSKLKLPKIKLPKTLKKLSGKSSKKDKSPSLARRKSSHYQSFKNDDDELTHDDHNDAHLRNHLDQRAQGQMVEGSSSSVPQEESGEGIEEEVYRYRGRTVQLDVLPGPGYDLLEESGYETMTSNSPNAETIAAATGNTEFWSFDDLRSNDDAGAEVNYDESDDDEKATFGGKLRRTWRSERAKSFRRSFRKSTKQSWKGLQMSLRHQMNAPNPAHNVLTAVSASRNNRR